jgi:hypothetical protein
LTTQIDALAEMWKSLAIVGSATLTTEDDTDARNVPSAVTVRPRNRARRLTRP